MSNNPFNIQEERAVGAVASGPWGLYFSQDDALRIAAYNSQSSVTLSVTGHMLLTSGRIVEIAFTLTPTTDRAETVLRSHIGSGFLLDLMVRPTAGNPDRGQCYVRVEQQFGTSSVGLRKAMLIADYVTDDFFPSYPNSPLRNSLEGRGAFRQVSVSDPAVATNFSEAVPTNAVWLLWSVNIRLVADANAANRFVHLQIDNAAGVTVARGGQNNQAVTANQTVSFSGNRGGFAGDGGSFFFLDIPTLPIPGGFTVESNVTNIQAGDQLDDIELFVEEFIQE